MLDEKNSAVIVSADRKDVIATYIATYTVIRPIVRGLQVCSAPTRNLQNIKDRHVDQSTKKRATPYCICMLPLLNHHGWEEFIFKKYGCMQDVL